MPYLPLIVLCLIFSLVTPAQANDALYTSELQLINQLNQYRLRQDLSALQLNREAARVARSHSQEMANRDFFALISPSRGTLEHQLGYQRVFAKPLHTLIALDYSLSQAFAQIQKNPMLLSEEASHLAVGIHTADNTKYGPKALWVTVILLKQMAEISPIPRTVDLNSIVRVSGRLNPGLHRPRMPMTLPKGRVITLPNLKKTAGTFEFEVPFTEGPGRYTLELLVDVPREGPKVAAIIPVYSGIPYPLSDQPSAPSGERFSTSNEAAEKVFQLLNQARREHNLAPLAKDPLLTYVAYQHSQNMAQKRFFAHINPDGDDPNDRFRNHGGFGHVGENIALDTRIDSAFRRLMGSPGHRANILSDQFTHAGMGVYSAGGQFYVTQLFQKKHPPSDPQRVRQGLLSWLNQERRNKGLTPLQLDERMSRAAVQHSQAMAAENTLSYEVDGLNYAERLQRLQGKRQEMNTIILLVEDLEQALAKLERNQSALLRPQWSLAGIGVVQAHSPELGENMLWITLGVSKP